MARPAPKDLFALYHLGLDAQGSYRFRNLSDVARTCAASPETVLQWLRESRIDPDTISHVDFNLSKWHVEAQFVAAADAGALVQKAWDGYQAAARDRRDPERVFHDVDYDDIWGDGRDADDLGNRR